MTRYQVHTCWYGRPVVKNGPMSGCVDFGRWDHRSITPRPIGLVRAKRNAVGATDGPAAAGRADGG